MSLNPPEALWGIIRGSRRRSTPAADTAARLRAEDDEAHEHEEAEAKGAVVHLIAGSEIRSK